MTREKSNAFEKINWKLKFFLEDVENAKNIIKKHIFLDFCCFSLFLDFSKNLLKRWVKIG